MNTAATIETATSLLAVVEGILSKRTKNYRIHNVSSSSDM
jgi:hypothetical protein